MALQTKYPSEWGILFEQHEGIERRTLTKVRGGGGQTTEHGCEVSRGQLPLALSFTISLLTVTLYCDTLFPTPQTVASFGSSPIYIGDSLRINHATEVITLSSLQSSALGKRKVECFLVCGLITTFLFFMAKTRQQKVVILTDVVRSFQGAKGMVFANMQGLKTTSTNELRAKCRENNLTFAVMKKTLLKRALSDIGLTIDTKSFIGGVSIVTGSDEVAPAQVVAAFARTHELAKIFGGVLEGKFIDAAKVSALAKLPSKQQLLGQLVGTINAPVLGFVNVLAGNLRGLVTVLNAVKDQKTA